MKLTNYIYTAAAVIFLAACSQDDVINTSPLVGNQVLSKNELTIQSYLTSTSPTTRGAVAKLEPIIVDNDTVMYVYNFENGGFEIFSNNETLPMILVKSKSDTFDFSKLTAEDPFYHHISIMASNIHNLQVNHLLPANKTAMWNRYDRNVLSSDTKGDNPVYVGVAVEAKEKTHTPKGGRLKTKWHQGTPYNNYAPFSDTDPTARCHAGCGAIAVGQYLFHTNKYFGVPKYTVETAVYDPNAKWHYNYSGETDKLWALIDDGSSDFLNNPQKIEATSLFIGSIINSIGSKFGITTPESSIGVWPNTERDYINKQTNNNYQISPFTIKDIVEILDAGRAVFAIS